MPSSRIQPQGVSVLGHQYLGQQPDAGQVFSQGVGRTGDVHLLRAVLLLEHGLLLPLVKGVSH